MSSLNFPAVIFLAFVLAAGFLLVILSCALWANWLPLLVGEFDSGAETGIGERRLEFEVGCGKKAWTGGGNVKYTSCSTEGRHR